MNVTDPKPGEIFKVACCPVHGLHGKRPTCFACGGPVEQVPVRVVSADAFEELSKAMAAADAYVQGLRAGHEELQGRALEMLCDERERAERAEAELRKLRERAS